MGCICGLAIGAWAHLMLRMSPDLPMVFSAGHLIVTVAVALFSAMTFAAAFGAMIPMILNRFGIDPAIASGPFISTANDISALLIYFGVTIAFAGMAS